MTQDDILSEHNYIFFPVEINGVQKPWEWSGNQSGYKNNVFWGFYFNIINIFSCNYNYNVLWLHDNPAISDPGFT